MGKIGSIQVISIDVILPIPGSNHLHIINDQPEKKSFMESVISRVEYDYSCKLVYSSTQWCNLSVPF
jgi:hypothetical protein